MRAPDARRWLREHGYEDLAARIDGLVEKWKRSGRKTRRDWWLVLAGTRAGRSVVVDGFAFPILKAARERQGFPPSLYAVERTEGERAPAIKAGGRWAPKGSETVAAAAE